MVVATEGAVAMQIETEGLRLMRLINGLESVTHSRLDAEILVLRDARASATQPKLAPRHLKAPQRDFKVIIKLRSA